MNEKEVYINYKRNNKWLGIIDYKSLMILFVYVAILWNILNFIPLTFEYKVYIFISLSIPIVVVFSINIKSESVVDVILIIIKYSFTNKIYLDISNLNMKNIKKTSGIFSKSDKK